jgi:hypothetical protein
LSLFDPPLMAAMNQGVIETPQGDILYEGPRVTVQYVADMFEVSDSTALRAVRALEKRGLVSITSVLDPANNRRRLWIIPVAKQRRDEFDGYVAGLDTVTDLGAAAIASQWVLPVGVWVKGVEHPVADLGDTDDREVEQIGDALAHSGRGRG